MGFWSYLFSNPGTVTGGDPEGVTYVGEVTESRSLPKVLPSPWDGWPNEWNVPDWDFGSKYNELVDVAWACLDLNARVLSSMPVYRTRSGQVVDPPAWMTNPDPTIYGSWVEFAKQLFWDYQLGEAFVLPMTTYTDGTPRTFRVIPPYMFDVTISGGVRQYRLGGPGGPDVTDDILHIRYKSATTEPHGEGPLASAGARMLTAGVLAKYVRTVVSTGGVPDYTLETADQLTKEDAEDLLNDWVAARKANLGYPPVLDNGVTLKTHFAMTPKDMAMIEISQFTESRIAVLLGVPPFLVALPSGNEMTYSNVSQVFDFHDRAGLRPYATSVMSALSQWALPAGQSAELNRDEYSRPAFAERAEAYERLVNIGVMSPDEVRLMERLRGDAPTVAAALTGGEQ